MTVTLVELRMRLAEQFDEVTLLELLNINSYDIIEAFAERVEDNYDRLLEELEEASDSDS
ncbi:hypothetical protein [Caudoviricetes sp.]|nr:hypothetical protein [Caudoviricetes sp.]